MPIRKKKWQQKSLPPTSATSDVHISTTTGGIPIYEPPASRFLESQSGQQPKAVFVEDWLDDNQIKAQVCHDMEQVPLTECCHPKFSHCESHDTFEPTCHLCRVKELDACFRAYHVQNVIPIQYMLLEQCKYQKRFMQELVRTLTEKELLAEWQPAIDGQKLQKTMEKMEKRMMKLEATMLNIPSNLIHHSLKESINDAQRKGHLMRRPPSFVVSNSRPNSRGSSRASSVSSRASHMSYPEIKAAAERHLEEAKERRMEKSLNKVDWNTIQAAAETHLEEAKVRRREQSLQISG